MQDLSFANLDTVLFIGAHSDDIEIGAGATILRLVRRNPNTRFLWLVCSGDAERRNEAENSAKAFLSGAAKSSILFGDLKDGHFPMEMDRLKALLEDLKPERPDLILTHFSKDLHQDHRAVCEATWNTFRDNLVLEYEIPKWDGGMDSPNFYGAASEEDTARKVEILMTCFPTQSSKHWFDELTFRGLMRIRGLECNAEHGFAEAFFARKLKF